MCYSGLAKKMSAVSPMSGSPVFADIISDKICSKTNNRNQGMVTKLNAIKGTGK